MSFWQSLEKYDAEIHRRWEASLFDPPPPERARRERQQRAWLLRYSGLTYRAIGRQIGGVSPERARQLVNFFQRHLYSEQRWWLREPSWPKRLLRLLE